ncbi:MAG TPA: CBS domain-containing protein [Nevskia sp.]|nr:CBS domain-containing protein [Nevskia sp.]
MRALDVMTSPVVTVPDSATVLEVAKLFVARRISAAPVVDGGGVMVGIVSEGDLLRREEIGTERRRPAVLEFMTSNRALAAEYVKSHSRRITDVMTTRVTSVDEAMPLVDIVDLMERQRIKRVPVVREGRPVGIVSRANLVRALMVFAREPDPLAAASDQAIRDSFLAELKDRKWSGANPATVVVQDGVLHLWGDVITEDERRALRVAAENTPGVKAVEDHTREPVLLPVG